MAEPMAGSVVGSVAGQENDAAGIWRLIAL